MNSREKVLAAVAQNQPAEMPLPDVGLFETGAAGSLEDFTKVLTAIGGKVYAINNLDEIDLIIENSMGIKGRVINLVDGLNLNNAEEVITDEIVHNLHNVEIAVIKANLGVAENGAVWVAEDNIKQRVLPFISQHLVVVIHQQNIVPAMHDAYRRLDQMSAYNYGSFIAGPSKTADIEQSLVIGAHGPKSMTVFVLK